MVVVGSLPKSDCCRLGLPGHCSLLHYFTLNTPTCDFVKLRKKIRNVLSSTRLGRPEMPYFGNSKFCDTGCPSSGKNTAVITPFINAGW